MTASFGRLYPFQLTCNLQCYQKITHMRRRWGTTQKFCLPFIDGLEKQRFIKKLLRWANKKCKNVNIYNVVFFFKIKENTWRYHAYQTSWWYELQFLKYRVWQTETGNYGTFFALLHPPSLKTWKIRVLKIWKKLLEILFYTCVPKTTIIWGMAPVIWGETFFVILGHVFPFYTTNNPQNPNFEKMTKASGDVIFYTTVPNITIIWCILPEI